MYSYIYISRMDSFLIGAYEWFVPKKQVYMAPSPCQLLVQRIYIYIHLHIYTYVCIFLHTPINIHSYTKVQSVELYDLLNGKSRALKNVLVIHNTLPETNIAPENRPPQKESSIPTIHI